MNNFQVNDAKVVLHVGRDVLSGNEFCDERLKLRCERFEKLEES